LDKFGATDHKKYGKLIRGRKAGHESGDNGQCIF